MKGSLIAPLFFLAVALACLGSRLGAVAPWAAAALALAAVAWAGTEIRRAITWLALPVLAYGALIALNTLLQSPAYTPAGLYHPLLLVGAFVAARSLTEHAERAAARAVLGLGLMLAVWGLAQIGPLGMARAQAIFETPAIYAAFLNLLLVPVIAAVLLGKRGVPLVAVAVALAAAIFAADSRGGLLASAAGFGVAAIFAMRAKQLRARSVAVALGLLAAGAIASAALRALPSPKTETAPSATARAESSLSRIELNALSWRAWSERPLAGTGYLTFRYVLEQGRSKVPSYGEANETWFVHNDYLQTLQELGPLALLAILGLTLLPPLIAWRRLPSLAEGQVLPVAASAATLAAMSVHALVDFPFHVPACLLLYGAWLGVLERRLGGQPVMPARRPAAWHRAVRAAAVTVAAVLLLRPLLAEAAAEWGLRQSASGESRSAAFWLGAAQRLDAAEWRYHWYAGQFWDAQAGQSGNRDAARLAAEAYAAGFAANSLEVRNLLGKISVHRRHRALLDSPADPRTLQDWRAQAAALAPFNPAVRREVAR